MTRSLESLDRLRREAIAQSFFPPTDLADAIRRLGFVQADPIRSPARAQDLILRHRVEGYRAGDLERRYPELDVEEDFLYAYGFVSRRVWNLLHPRKLPALPAFSKRVHATVRDHDSVHPRDLEVHFGRDRVVNAWGGRSKATTRALEDLHHRGLLRVARREGGVRIYGPANRPADPLPPGERLSRLLLAVVDVLTPVPERTLRAVAARLSRYLAGAGDHRAAISGLLGGGKLEKLTIEGLTYVRRAAASAPDEASRRVRLLAPFDPLVWDRLRFEHLWQWSYRFEAYTPPAKRVRGYYAMPLLWADRIIGWANVAAVGPRVDIELGFVERRPRDRAFRSELDLEVSRMETFLDLGRARD